MMTWKSRTSGPLRRLWSKDAPRTPLAESKSLQQGPWAVQPKPRIEPSTQELPILDGAVPTRGRTARPGE
jgi:hypothetical protein